jgi:hypothetical protein
MIGEIVGARAKMRKLLKRKDKRDRIERYIAGFSAHWLRLEKESNEHE